MARFLSGMLFAFLCFCVPALAAGQAASPGSTPTFQVNANLVVLDVTVTDSHGDAVRGLTPSDFTVLENGRQQTIRIFREHTAGEQATAPAVPRLAPGTFTNYTPIPATGPINILLFDALNTPVADWGFAQKEVQKYLKEYPPGAPMAIFGLSSQLRLLQGFTSDPETLRAALNGKALKELWNNLGVFGQMKRTANGLFYGYGRRGDMEQIRISYTLGAFNQLGRYLSSIPGRKNLIWISASFPINNLAGPGALGVMPDILVSFEDEFRDTTDLLDRSQVAVYPVDARGLMVGPIASAAHARAPGPQTESNFLTTIEYEHQAMTEIADGTGGKAFVNTNGIAKAVAEAVEDGADYYMIAYTPADQRWNGRYRNVHIQVARHGVALAYRHGYYADDPDAPIHPDRAANAPNAPAPYNAMDAAMEWGSPGPTQILFDASVRPFAGISPRLAPGNRKTAKMKGPYRSYSVRFDLDPRELDCAPAPGTVHQCLLDSVVFVYNADGTRVNLQADRLRLSIPPARWKAWSRSDLHFRRTISVPVKGDYFLRIGVLDDRSGRIGALEVPVTSVSKLSSLSARLN